MSIAPYTEPLLTVAVLDYCKPIESYHLLRSIKQFVQIPHKTIFLDNGSNEDYSLSFLREGLIDQLLVNRESLGLGIGTRDLINAVQSPYFAYVQNDQIFGAPLYAWDFARIQNELESPNVKSVSLAGFPCGEGIFSERAHVMKTAFYKSLEPLSFGGAGKWHNHPWREGQIQELYRQNGWLHIAGPHIIRDNGVYALREMGDGGVWLHRTDTKFLFCIIPPTVKNPAYPKVNDEEFALAAAGQWPDGRIPEAELKDSFDCWSGTPLAQMQDDYVKDLRRRFAEKMKAA